MKRVQWKQIRCTAITLLPEDHPVMTKVIDDILDHVRSGLEALKTHKAVEAKYHRDCASWLVWRMNVDGVTSQGVRWDSAKYETRLAGRWSSAAARALRESDGYKDRAQSSLQNALMCDHIAPRSCVIDALISCDSWLQNVKLAREFLLAHRHVAIITPKENALLNDAGFQSEMPEEWWNAELSKKIDFAHSRYTDHKVNISISQWEQPTKAAKND